MDIRTNLTWPIPSLHTRFGAFGLNQAFLSSLTLSMSHHTYDKWLDKDEVGIHFVQPSPRPDFPVMGVFPFG